MNKPHDNIEFITERMNYSRQGALMQVFIIAGLEKYAELTCQAPPGTFANGLFNEQAWRACAVEFLTKLAEFQGREAEIPEPRLPLHDPSGPIPIPPRDVVLEKQNAAMRAVLERWLGIDDWQDEAVAPAALVIATRQALAGTLSPPDREIQRMLVISTSHLPVAARRWLDGQTRPTFLAPHSRKETPVLIVDPIGDYGWRVCLAKGATEQYLVEQPANDPLARLLCFGIEQGCDWLALDRDAEAVAGLPTYEDGD